MLIQAGKFFTEDCRQQNRLPSGKIVLLMLLLIKKTVINRDL